MSCTSNVLMSILLYFIDSIIVKLIKYHIPNFLLTYFFKDNFFRIVGMKPPPPSQDCTGKLSGKSILFYTLF